MQLYAKTGNKKYLEPIPRAIEYLRRSQLHDGRLARFYELRTSRPLYFTKDYQLTYSDADMPTHYAFKVPNGLDRLQRAYEELLKADPRELAQKRRRNRSASKPSSAMIAQVKKVIAALDDQGRWVEDGKLRYQPEGDASSRVIDCRTFISNVRLLGQYLASTGGNQ